MGGKKYSVMLCFHVKILRKSCVEQGLNLRFYFVEILNAKTRFCLAFELTNC